MSQLAEAALAQSDADAVSPKPEPVVFVAGLWRRVAAALLDGLCLAPAMLLFGWLAFRVTGLEAPAELRFESVLELLLEGGGTFYGALFAALIIVMMYGFLFVAVTGATPGLRALRLRVIDVYGDAPRWWRVVLRGIGLLAGTLLLGLGVLWVGFDREKRGLHDWIAGTYVIRAAGGARRG